MYALAEQCKKVKEEKGITNQVLSELSGVPKGTVDSFFRASTRSPTVDTAGPICAVLGVSMDDFYGVTVTVDTAAVVCEGDTAPPEDAEDCSSAAEFLEKQLSDVAAENKTLQAQTVLQREIIDKQNHGIRMRDHIMLHLVIILVLLLAWSLYVDMHCIDFGIFRG